MLILILGFFMPTMSNPRLNELPALIRSGVFTAEHKRRTVEETVEIWKG
jgi:hypothetical protein